MGYPFWIGAGIFFVIVWLYFHSMTNNHMLSCLIASVMCFIGGLIAQCLSDIVRARRHAGFRRIIRRWVAVIAAYSFIVGLTIFWAHDIFGGSSATLIAIVLMALPVAPLISHFQKEQTQTKFGANHGLESTGAPPAAGTPETHP